MEGNDEGVPDELFADRTLRPLVEFLYNQSVLTYHNIVSVPNPATEDLVYIPSPYPIFQSSVDDTVFKQRASEEDDHKKH